MFSLFVTVDGTYLTIFVWIWLTTIITCFTCVVCFSRLHYFHLKIVFINALYILCIANLIAEKCNFNMRSIQIFSRNCVVRICMRYSQWITEYIVRQKHVTITANDSDVDVILNNFEINSNYPINCLIYNQRTFIIIINWIHIRVEREASNGGFWCIITTFIY